MQRKTAHADCGEAAQRIQEGWKYLQTADAGGQRGGQQHLEWKLYPADVELCAIVVLHMQLFFFSLCFMPLGPCGSFDNMK